MERAKQCPLVRKKPLVCALICCYMVLFFANQSRHAECVWQHQCCLDKPNESLMEILQRLKRHPSDFSCNTTMVPVGWTSSVFHRQDHSLVPAIEFVLTKQPCLCLCAHEHLWNTSVRQSELGEGELEDLQQTTDEEKEALKTPLSRAFRSSSRF